MQLQTYINISRNTLSCQLDTSAFEEHICNRHIPSTATLFETSNNNIPLIEKSSVFDHISLINISTDFFDHKKKQYTMDGTMRCQ